MSQAPPSRDADKFVIRMPARMRPRIAKMAKTNRRSMNSEIVFRLEQVIAAQGDEKKTAPTGVPAPAEASPEA